MNAQTYSQKNFSTEDTNRTISTISELFHIQKDQTISNLSNIKQRNIFLSLSQNTRDISNLELSKMLLPNIGISSKKTKKMNKIFPDLPLIAFNRANNIQDKLIRAKLPPAKP